MKTETRKIGSGLLEAIDNLPNDPAHLKKIMGWYAAHQMQSRLRIAVLEAELERNGIPIPAALA
jgi:hypothetical protein